MSDELLRAMWDAFQRHELTGHTDSPMVAVLDVLHANGYRRCAEGQRTTQWCAEAERIRTNLKALEDEHIAYAEDVGDALGQGEDEPLLTCARRVVAELEQWKQAAELAREDHNCEYGRANALEMRIERLESELTAAQVTSRLWHEAVKERRVLPTGRYYGPDEKVPVQRHE